MSTRSRTIASFFSVAMAAMLLAAVVTSQVQRPAQAADPLMLGAAEVPKPRGPVTLDSFRDIARLQTPGVVNINTADAAQLALLPRIGEKAAQRIIEYRTQHGSFKKTSELMQVKGIGAKTYERLAPYIVVEGKTTLGAKVQSPRKPRAKKPATTASN